MSEVTISVIIPVYNHIHELKKCLNALEKQSTNQPFEILLVDNGSDDDIKLLADQFSKVTYLKETKVGSYAARNHGLRHASGKYIAFTDADCIPEYDWLQKGINFLNEHSECDAIGGKVQLLFKAEKPNNIELYDMIFGFQQEKSVAKYNYSVTANLFVRKVSFEKFGWFNEGLKSNGDTEWCQRMVSQGGKLCYAREAVIHHPALRTLKQFKRKHVRIAGGRFQNENFDFYKLTRASYHHLISLKTFRLPLTIHETNISFRKKVSLYFYHFLKIMFYIISYLKIYAGAEPER